MKKANGQGAFHKHRSCFEGHAKLTCSRQIGSQVIVWSQGKWARFPSLARPVAASFDGSVPEKDAPLGGLQGGME